MSRRLRNRSPFWQDNVLHVPTSPFMSPVQSPAASPAHSPLSSPRNRRSQAPDVDIASAILTSMRAPGSVFSIDELLASWASSRGLLVVQNDPDDENNDDNDDDNDESGGSNNPIDVDEEEGEQYHLNRSIQRAYNEFLSTAQQQHLLPRNRSVSPLAPPPPPPTANRLRLPPPPPQMVPPPTRLSERRPTNLRVVTNRTPRIVVRLPNGGYSFAPYSTNGALIVSPQRSRRRSTQTLSTAHRPLVRQAVTLSDANIRRRIARNRVWQYTRQLSEAAQSDSLAARSAASARVSGFKLTESFGLPGDKCAICLEPYKFGDTVSYVACQPRSGEKDHLFHTHCITEWVATQLRSGNYTRTCPVCRGEF